MLPHNQQAEGQALRRMQNGNLCYCWYGQTQHLYLTSNREIQAGDWWIAEGVNIPTHCTTPEDLRMIRTFPERYQKIEATTDPALWYDEFNKAVAHWAQVPQVPKIPQSFVEKYAQVQGKIEEVLVVIDLKQSVHTRTDGTVIVHRVKDSWTREEVSHLLTIAMVQMSDWKNEGKVTAQLDRLMKDWIKEQF
jgi:hypothetical protein